MAGVKARRCEKCGARRVQRGALCGAIVKRFGQRYYCGGRLVELPAVVRPEKPKPAPQDIAAAKLEHARRQIREVSKRIKRASTSLRLWERRAAYYAKRASMTDAELEAERTRKAKKPTPATRLYAD